MRAESRAVSLLRAARVVEAELALAQVEQLVSKALAMSMMAATDPVTLTDKTGTIHTIEAQNLSVLMLHYGFGYQQLWGRRAAARAAINAANDAETVTGVTL